MANRGPVLTEDSSGAGAPIEPGALVAGSPGYWKWAVAALSGVSTFGATLVAAASAAAAKSLLSLSKADVGLGNVDNTTDLGKPVSTAQAAADALKYDKAGGSISGNCQIGGTFTATSTTNCPAYFGKASVQVQHRLGDPAGYCWSFGRENTTTGDLIIEPTAPNAVAYFANAIRVLWASGVCRFTYGSQTGASGTTITQVKVYTPTLAPALVSAGAPVEESFTVTGLSTGDKVAVNAPGMAVFSARVSAANTLALTFFPPASGSYTPPAGVYNIIAHRS